MGEIGDIYEVKHKYHDPDNRACENVYFYRRGANAVSSTPSYAQQLANAWNTDVLTPSLATYPPLFVSYEIDVRNLFDAAEQYNLAISRAGSRGVVTEYLPTFVTAKATMSVDNGLVKKGRKSFSGLLEGDQNAGLLSALGLATMVNRTAFVLVQLVGAAIAGYVFQPVVVKRIPVIDPPNPVRYELPSIIGEAIFGYITSAVVSAIISSQVTRKD